METKRIKINDTKNINDEELKEYFGEIDKKSKILLRIFLS